MKKLYLLLVPVIALLFSFNVNAATTIDKYTSPTLSLNTGDNVFYEAQIYTSKEADEIYAKPNNDNQNYSNAVFNVQQNVLLKGFTSNKYYTGYISFYIRITATPGTGTNLALNGVPTIPTKVTDGINLYYMYNNGYHRFTLIFDNYYMADNWLQIPTIVFPYVMPFISPSLGNTPTATFRPDGWINSSYSLQVTDKPNDPLYQMDPSESSIAEEIEEEYSSYEDQANSIADQLNDIEMPNISSGNLNILGTVDGTQKNNFFQMLSIITHTELVTKIMLIIVIGSLVGFILYGKKG